MEICRKNIRNNEIYSEKQLTNNEINVRQPHALFTRSLLFTGKAWHYRSSGAKGHITCDQLLMYHYSVSQNNNL